MKNSKSQESLIKAKYIIVWQDDTHKILEDGYLTFKEERFTGFGKEPPQDWNKEIIDFGNVLITPGFINLHCHPPGASIAKSYIEDIGNDNFHQSCLFDLGLVLDFKKEEAKDVAYFTLAELLSSGCTTIVDAESNNDIAELVGKMGIRAYLGAQYRSSVPGEPWETKDGHSLDYNLDEEKGFEQLQEAKNFVEKYEGLHNGRVRTLLAPTQTTTCSADLLKETRKLADDLDIGITIHAAEAMMEFRECIRRYGKTPVEFLYDLDLLGSDVILGHVVFVSGHSQTLHHASNDLGMIVETNSSVAHCPWVFARKGTSIMESYPKYLAKGINVGIGTDTFTSDIIQEMRYAAMVGKLLEKNCHVATAKDVFNSATIMGAKALNRNDLGKITNGAKADFVVFELDNFEMSPVRDPIKNLVYSSTRHSIDKVFVDGECLLDNGNILRGNEKQAAQKMQNVAENTWSNTSKLDWNNRSVNELSPLTFPKYTE